MECPSCSNEIQAVGATCPLCGVLIRSPEAGSLSSPARRLGAYILDIILWGIIAACVFTIVAAGAAAGSIILPILGIVFLFGFQIFVWAKSTSPGKWALGMKVYRTSGKPLGFFGMLVRETIGKFISGLILSLGYLWIIWDRDKQAWHDKLVGSVVVDRAAAVKAQKAEAA